ncbi:helix-turn-helix domain-containing protein [Streptomyces sp. CEV 2-1]|uniref:helix-turn-helix domain-containing protein n=1 Tax=Streptomyces sp. CEV 2-1 TaxID=2485153 RepID=UPI0021A8E3F9|nr:helix-turn-helix domain-containing protein [Streptomyces sp. CEV 2-1]
MPVTVACAIFLTATDRKRLKKVAWGHKSEYRQRVRAQIVLHAAHGRSNAHIARETDLHLDTVRRCRRRFAEQGLAGLRDRQRSGRPSSFTPLQAVEVKALACRLPAESGVPLSRWVVSGAGPRGRHTGHRHLPVSLHRAPLAQDRRAQAVAAPLLDLHH